MQTRASTRWTRISRFSSAQSGGWRRQDLHAGSNSVIDRDLTIVAKDVVLRYGPGDFPEILPHTLTRRLGDRVAEICTGLLLIFGGIVRLRFADVRVVDVFVPEECPTAWERRLNEHPRRK